MTAVYPYEWHVVARRPQKQTFEASLSSGGLPWLVPLGVLRSRNGCMQGDRGADVAPSGLSAGEGWSVSGGVYASGMPFQTTTIPVLIASPGDTKAERAVVEDAILSWNSDHTLRSKVHLLPLRWELEATPMLGRGTAQEMINDQFADSADIVIGLFYSRLGQPTASAASGTAEEIERAMERGAVVGVYCSSAQLPNDVDVEQLRALRDFRVALQSRGLLGDYASPDDLKAKIRSFLERAVSRLITDGPSHQVPGASGPLAILRSEYVSEPETYVDSRGRVKTRQRRQRLRVSNIGAGPAEQLRVEVEPLGEGESPVVDEDMTTERLLDHSHFDIPVALTFGTSPQARVTMTWDEGGQEFSESQVIRWM